jgi:hypothetical protein
MPSWLASLQSRRERSCPVLRVVLVQSSARSAAPCPLPLLKANQQSLYKLDEKRHPRIALSRDLGPDRTATANSEAKMVFSASANGLIGQPPMDSTHPSHFLGPSPGKNWSRLERSRQPHHSCLMGRNYENTLPVKVLLFFFVCQPTIERQLGAFRRSTKDAGGRLKDESVGTSVAELPTLWRSTLFAP